MALSSGKEEYKTSKRHVFGYGISYNQEEIDAAIVDPITEIVFDVEGTADVTGLLESVVETEFDKDQLKRVLEHRSEPENWRVGEALAELFLNCRKACIFPWPDGRDERKSGSSLPGADLVGFKENGNETLFSFGEVKTSSEYAYPPGTMYGRTGLKQQLEDLRDKVGIRDDLVKYLAHRAVNASWKDVYIRAFKKYIINNEYIQLYGILIRDVPPHEDDLRARILSLGSSCSDNMCIEMYAIYLPFGSIENLGKKVTVARGEGEL